MKRRARPSKADVFWAEAERYVFWGGIALVTGLFVGSCLAGCGGTQKPPVFSPDVANADLTIMATAWNAAASSCLAMAGVPLDGGTPTNPALAHECGAVLQPVHDAIVQASVDVSIWDDAAQSNYMCMMKDISLGLVQAINSVPTMPVAVSDAALVAAGLGRACVDAGQ